MRLFRFQHPGPHGGHLLSHERHREADPRDPGRQQGRHALVPELGDDRRHPDLECECYNERYSDLYSTVQCKFAFIADAR